MPIPRTIDVQDVINDNPVSRYQVLIMALCFCVVAIDGFDTAAVGFIAPALRAKWSLTPAQLAPLFGAGLFGLMIGAFIFGPLADKVGRKPIVIAATMFFGVATVVSAWASSIEMLTALRFVTGLGLGGAMPTAFTLTSEFCPERKRATLGTVMLCGFTAGSASAGLAASHVVAAYGWQGLLILGGVLPLVLTPILWMLLPESVRFLTLKGAPSARIAATLQRLAPGAALDGAVFTGARKPQGSPMLQLFRGGLVASTLLIWLTFFMSLLVFYLLSSWLPLLITTAGFSMANASLMAATLATGGTIGAIVIGRLMDRFNPHGVLAGAYVVAGLFVVLLGNATTEPWLLVFAIFGAGFGVAGAQVGMNALAAATYPTASRATGVSWANGVGRIGSVLGSMVGGLLLSVGWDLSTVFTVAAIPAFLAGGAMLLKGALGSRGALAIPAVAR